MAGMDENLIKAITEQVIKAMAQGREIPAAINPPAGTCDGTFKPQPSDTNPTSIEQPKSNDIPLTGIVTAHQIEQMVKIKGYALVAQDARLTPLANDYARQHKDKIKRANPIGGTLKSNPQRGAARNWFWWIDGACPVVRKVTTQRRTTLSPMANPRKAEATLSVIRDLARAVHSGHVVGGVLFVPNAAKAVCYANRCPSLRAIVGTSQRAVEEGARELGANVLIIEYTQHAKTSVDAMLDTFLAHAPIVDTLTQRALAELHRLG